MQVGGSDSPEEISVVPSTAGRRKKAGFTPKGVPRAPFPELVGSSSLGMIDWPRYVLV